jgi:hypothetical protein
LNPFGIVIILQRIKNKLAGEMSYQTVWLETRLKRPWLILLEQARAFLILQSRFQYQELLME